MHDTQHPGDGPVVSAPFVRRLVARAIDLLLALPLTFLLVVPLAILSLPVTMSLDDGSRAYDLVISAIASLAYFLAYVMLEWFLLVRRGGQTLGKGLMGLRVLSDRHRAGLTVGSSFVRLAVLFAPFALLSVAGGEDASAVWDRLADLGLVVLLVSAVLALVPSARRRAVHDLVAGSRVVRAPRRGIDLKKDIPMMIPGRVDLTKR